MTHPTQSPSPEGESGDIVARLLAEGACAMRQHLSLGMHKLCFEAAEEIKRLRSQLSKAEQLLQVVVRDNPPTTGQPKRHVLDWT